MSYRDTLTPHLMAVIRCRALGHKWETVDSYVSLDCSRCDGNLHHVQGRAVITYQVAVK